MKLKVHTYHERSSFVIMVIELSFPYFTISITVLRFMYLVTIPCVQNIL